jgi:hypothetical protein
MKKQPKNKIIKLSERFDKQLLAILAQELEALKSMRSNSNTGLLVA